MKERFGLHDTEMEALFSRYDENEDKMISTVEQLNIFADMDLDGKQCSVG